MFSNFKKLVQKWGALEMTESLTFENALASLEIESEMSSSCLLNLCNLPIQEILRSSKVQCDLVKLNQIRQFSGPWELRNLLNIYYLQSQSSVITMQKKWFWVLICWFFYKCCFGYVDLFQPKIIQQFFFAPLSTTTAVLVPKFRSH